MCPVWLVLEAMLPSLIADLKVPTISSDISTAVCCADEKISGLRPSNVSQRLATSPIVSLCLCHREILPGRCSHAAWAARAARPWFSLVLLFLLVLLILLLSQSAEREGHACTHNLTRQLE